MFKSIIFKSVIILSIFSLFLSCTKEKHTLPLKNSKEKDTIPLKATLETKTFSNLNAPQSGGQGQTVGGEFKKFSFSQNSIVTNDSWDIAFRGTQIIVNGGTQIGITNEPTRTGIGAVSIVSNTLNGVNTIPEISTFKQDAKNSYAIPTGSGNGWYFYNSTTHIISPLAGKIFVVKTHDGKYAKMEIISYYKDAPAKPDLTTLSRYYTFKYVYQPNGTSF